MRICVINFSGNVGKTLVAAQLLQPRLNAPVISVESLNADAEVDGVSVERLRGKEFWELQQRVATADALIVDVGASNVETFLRLLRQSAGSHEEYDLFVVPVAPARKQQIDTINTLRALNHLGVEPERVRVVFNALDPDDPVESTFAPVAAFGNGECFHMKQAVVVHYNEVFERIKGSGRSVADIMADPTDWRAVLRASTDEAQRSEAAVRLALRRLAGTASANLDRAYAALVA